MTQVILIMMQLRVNFARYCLKEIQRAKKSVYGIFALLFLYTVAPQSAQASVLGDLKERLLSTETLEGTVHDLSVSFALVAGTLIAIFTLLCLIIHNKGESMKKFLFYGFTTATLLPTLFFTISTVYVNVVSETKGPVHWHLDFKIYSCGEELELIGPDGRFENKVGTPTFHHHVDKRIHVEGVVVDRNDVLLDDFFRVIGGKLVTDSLTIPSTEGLVTLRNGDTCPGSGKAVLQAFLYRVDENDKTKATLIKLGDDFPKHLMHPEASVPPGDCVVFEFGAPMETTDNLCDFWKIAEEKGDVTITR